MLRDFAIPPIDSEPEARPETRFGSTIQTATWTAETLRPVLEHLHDPGALRLRAVPQSRLVESWEETIEVFLDPRSEARRELTPALASACALSEAGLQAGLEAVLGGMRGEPLRRLANAAHPVQTAAVTTVLLSANLPALAVQTLFPALSVGRPVLFKCSSAEPLFAPAFVRELIRREPALADSIAAVTWKGGREDLESLVFSSTDCVLAYGSDETMDSLRRRLGVRLVAFGPKISFAVVDGTQVETVAAGIARDIALFDQRGCLSVHAVYTFGEPRKLAAALAAELGQLQSTWPPGAPTAASLAAVQQFRTDAELRGLFTPPMQIEAGTVIVEPQLGLQVSPGLRSVRVYALATEASLLDALEPWRGRLQGAALHGPRSCDLAENLYGLGVSRIAGPGELQSTDALWHNGGMHPLEALGGRPPTPHSPISESSA